MLYCHYLSWMSKNYWPLFDPVCLVLVKHNFNDSSSSLCNVVESQQNACISLSLFLVFSFNLHSLQTVNHICQTLNSPCLWLPFHYPPLSPSPLSLYLFLRFLTLKPSCSRASDGDLAPFTDLNSLAHVQASDRGSDCPLTIREVYRAGWLMPVQLFRGCGVMPQDTSANLGKHLPLKLLLQCQLLNDSLLFRHIQSQKTHMLPKAHTHLQIGRASCRERV